MFETSVINERAIAAPRKAGVLSMSIAFHSLFAAAAVTMSIQSWSFPIDAPRQMAMFQMTPVVELPRGNPNAVRDQQPKPPQQQPAQHAQTAPQVPQQDVVPNQIPSTTTPLASTDTAGPGTGDGHDTSGQWGVPDGSEHGIDIGQAVTQPQVSIPSGPLVPGGDVRAARVLSRVEPRYPDIAIKSRIAGVVKVQCIIDKEGKVSDPQIVSSTFPAFNQSVMNALMRWTFAPGTLHGQPVDTYFELTITFTPR
jgi:periplasmic protein TonB